MHQATKLYDKDPSAAVALAETAAASGHVPAMLALANHHSRGRFLDVLILDDSNASAGDAKLWFRAALEVMSDQLQAGDTTVVHKVAAMLYRGIGTVSQRERAKKMMEKYALDGDDMAAVYAVHWYAADDERVEADALVDKLVKKDFSFAHRVRAEALVRHSARAGEEVDVVAVVEALSMARDKGDAVAAIDLAELHASIKASADNGEQDAIDSRDRLTVAGLWNAMPMPRAQG